MDRSVAQAAFVVLAALVVSLVGFIAADPAIACFPPWACTTTPQPAPAPLIGVGLPVAGAAFAALVIIRHFRGKD